MNPETPADWTDELKRGEGRVQRGGWTRGRVQREQLLFHSSQPPADAPQVVLLWDG